MKKRILLLAFLLAPLFLQAQTSINQAMSVWARNIVNANFTSTFASTATNTTNIATNVTDIATLETLADGKIYLGNGTDVATEITLTGDVTVSNSGVTAIGGSKVVNAMVNTGIDAIKLADGTVTNTELQYINSVTSNVQTQITNNDSDISALEAISDSSYVTLSAETFTSIILGTFDNLVADSIDVDTINATYIDSDILLVNTLATFDNVVIDSIDVDSVNAVYIDVDELLVNTSAAFSGALDQTIENVTAGGDRAINTYISQTTVALTGELIGIKANARVNYESGAGTVRGGHFSAGNMDAGYSLTTATGVMAEVTNKIPSGAVTWTNAIGMEINMDLDQGTSGNENTITNSYMIYGVYNLPTVGTYSTVTNGYGAFLRNEAVGGTGQMLDAGYYLDDLNHSGGILGWDYGLDFSGIGANSGNFGTADIRLANGETIDNTTDGTINFTADTLSLNGINMEKSFVISVTVGWDGASGTDFVWAGDADHTAQNLDLGAIVPAKAKVTAIEVVCTEAAVGVTDITLGIGNQSAGAEFIVAISCDDANEVAGIIDPALPQAVVMNWTTATDIWMIGDPTDNTWGGMSAGLWTVYVTYTQY